MQDLNDQQLHDLYIADLSKEVCYDGKNTRQRVRRVSNYKRISSWYKNQPVDLTTAAAEGRLWVWSDQHIGHSNIIQFTERPFRDVDHMTAQFIKNHNRLVSDNDVVVWVGDIGFKSDQYINDFLDRCKGYKILIVGNHDLNKGKLRKLNVDESHLVKHFYYNGVDYVFTHYTFDNLPFPYINIHGHIHDRSSRHVHQINVCVEQTFVNYEPVNFSFLHNIGRARTS